MTTANAMDSPRGKSPIPADLAAAVVLLIAVNIAVFAPVIRETPLRIPLGFVFILFVPGYVLIAAVFPEGDNSTSSEPTTKDDPRDHPLSSSITLLERIVFSFGGSIALVPLVGLALNSTAWGIRLVPMMVAVSGVTLLAAALATVRRLRVPEANRFQIPYQNWLAWARTEFGAVNQTVDVLIVVVLIGAVVFAMGSAAYAIAGPSQSEQFSSVTLLTETDDGELVTEDYPTELGADESGAVVLMIDNDEREQVTYTVVAVEQRTTSDGNETTVEEQNELESFEEEIGHGETWIQDHEFEPSMTGDHLQIVWLVYLDGEVPADPSVENAPYSVQLSIEINE